MTVGTAATSPSGHSGCSGTCAGSVVELRPSEFWEPGGGGAGCRVKASGGRAAAERAQHLERATG